MVFELVSHVHSRNSFQEIPISTDLYNPKTYDIEVENPFGQDVLYNIQLIYERGGGVAKAPQKKSAQGQRNLPKGKEGGKDKNKVSSIPEPFFCRLEQIKVRKNLTAIVPITFLPFEMVPHKCYIIFTDEGVGELQYTMIG